MNLTGQLAKNLREVHFGENWTWSNLKEHLSDVSWQEATTQVCDFNTIATLVYHMNYYLNTVSNALQGRSVDAKHKQSFEHPEIRSQEAWEQLLNRTWAEAELFARLIEQMSEDRVWKDISPKHGNYYRNITGVIEHSHYHLGQIVLLKRILRRHAKSPLP
jgi:hypothetical protein